MNRNTCYTGNMTPYGSRPQNRSRYVSSIPERPSTSKSSIPERPSASEPCGCTEENSWKREVPIDNRQKLLCYINEVSFAMYDALLYLDTHDDDEKAREFFNQHNRKRKFAMEEYAKAYGPLTVSSIEDSSCSWKWVHQPWPWEGGDC